MAYCKVHTCQHCGKKFDAKSSNARYCAKCRPLVAHARLVESRAKNREQIRERSRQNYAQKMQNDPEYQKKTYQKYKEKKKAYAKADYYRNIEARRAKSREYRAAHVDAQLEKQRAAYWKDPAKARKRVRDYHERTRMEGKVLGPAALFRLAELRGEIQECERLRLKCRVLPCGKTDQCFMGKERCPRLPEGATLPKIEFGAGQFNEWVDYSAARRGANFGQGRRMVP